jgi:hypothetical protein
MRIYKKLSRFSLIKKKLEDVDFFFIFFIASTISESVIVNFLR